MRSLGLMFAQNGVYGGGMCHINRPNYLMVKKQRPSNCTYLNQEELGHSIWGVAGECFAFFFMHSLIQ